MTGIVDGFGRAVIPIRMQRATDGAFVEIEAWIDTGFTGDLSFRGTLFIRSP